LGLEATISSIPVKGVEGRRSGSLQESARRVRYDFLEKVAAQVGAGKIALGHNRDDQAETVLINLLRGAGMPGLRGIPPVREGRYIRPLIETSREEIEEYALGNRIPFVTDSSNLKASYLRNRIRLHLLPLLLQYNPRLPQILAGIASILAEEEALLESLAASHLSSILLSEEKQTVILSTALLLREPVALRRRILIAACRMAASSYLPLSHRHVFALEELLLSQSGARLSLPGGMTALKDYDRLIVTKEARPPFAAGWQYALPLDGDIRVPEARARLKAAICPRDGVDLKDSTPLRACLDAGKIRFPLLLRSRRPGDAFFPLGGRGKKKLKKFFIDAKVSRARRDEIPLLISGGEIVWVVGLRIDQRFRVQEGTEKIVMVEMIPDERD
jgi:tRNA(Ile)-lysidine synthase